MDSVRDVLQIIDGIGKMCHSQINQIAHISGLSEVQVIILREIQMAKCINAAQLVKLANLSIYRINVQIDYLLRKNLIERAKDNEDKRAWKICLSNEGDYLLKSSSLIKEKLVQKFNHLPDDQKDQILSSLQQVAKLIDD